MVHIWIKYLHYIIRYCHHLPSFPFSITNIFTIVLLLSKSPLIYSLDFYVTNDIHFLWPAIYTKYLLTSFYRNSNMYTYIYIFTVRYTVIDKILYGLFDSISVLFCSKSDVLCVNVLRQSWRLKRQNTTKYSVIVYIF